MNKNSLPHFLCISHLYGCFANSFECLWAILVYLSVYLAFPFMIIGGLLLFVASNMFSDMIAMTIHIGVMFIVSLILYLRLMSVGPKLYGKLSV